MSSETKVDELSSGATSTPSDASNSKVISQGSLESVVPKSESVLQVSSSTTQSNNPEADIEALKNWYAPHQRMLADRVPSTCSGASVLCAYVFVVGVCGILVPACVLFPVAAKNYSTSDYEFKLIIVIASCILLVTIGYILGTLARCLRNGLPCNMPPRPPLESAFVQKKAHRKITWSDGKKIAAIYNPHGGLGLAARAFEILQNECKDRGVECIGFQTQYAGHAHVLAQYEIKNLAQFSALVVIGGDGTVFEATNGLLKRSDHVRVPMAIIPAGSGNSLSADLGTWNISTAVKRIFVGETMLVDVNRVTTVDRADFERYLATLDSQPTASTNDTRSSGTHYFTTALPNNQDSALGVEDASVAAENDTKKQQVLIHHDLDEEIPAMQTDLDRDFSLIQASDSYIRVTPNIGDIIPNEGQGYSSTEPGVKHLNMYSVNLVSLGLIGDIGTTADLCRCMGPVRYDICGLWGLLKGYEKTFTFVYRDMKQNVMKTITQPMVTLFAMSTQYFGKGHRASPYSRLDDGLMNIIHLMGTRVDLLTLFQQVPSGSHVNWENKIQQTMTSEAWFVRNLTADEERSMATALRGGVINVDGEGFPMVDGALHIRVLPREIEIFASPNTLPLDSLNPDA